MRLTAALTALTVMLLGVTAVEGWTSAERAHAEAALSLPGPRTVVEGFDPTDDGLWVKWGEAEVRMAVPGYPVPPTGEMSVVDAPAPAPADGQYTKAAYFPNLELASTDNNSWAYVMRIQAEVAEGASISFWLRTDTADSHFLTFGTWSGTGGSTSSHTHGWTKDTEWKKFTVHNLPAGVRTFEWAYVNSTAGGSYDHGANTAWVTGIEIEGYVSPALPVEQAFGYSGAPSEFGYRPVGEQADPVTSATGAFTTAVVDASFPAVGVDFALERTYNSNRFASTAGGLGAGGWRHTYQANLTFPGPNRVWFHAGDGQRLGFAANQDGTYRADPGVTAKLVRQGDGTYELSTRSGIVRRFTSAGRLTRIEDHNGQGLDVSYDLYGRMRTVSAGDRAAQFTYNAFGHLARATLSDGRYVAYTYSPGPSYRLTQVRDLAGDVTTYQYGSSGRLDRITDALGNVVVRMTYNAAGRVTDQWDALDNHTQFDWDAATGTATMTDPRGGQWKDVYRGNVLHARIDPEGNTTGYKYDADFQLTAVVAPDGGRTELGYDADGNLTTTVLPDGAAASTTYGFDHRVLSVTNPRGQTVTYAYDGAGNVTSASYTLPDGRLAEETFTYTTAGQRASSTSVDGRTSLLSYNPSGDLVGVTSPAGAHTAFAHDAMGRLTQVTSPAGRLTQYSYNARDQLVMVTDPIGRVTTMTYDAAGRLTTLTDPRGRAFTITYDLAGRVVASHGPGSLLRASMTYDAAGYLVASTDIGGQVVSYAYDLAGRLVAVTDALGTWGFGHDTAGRRVSVTNPAGGTTSISHDSRGRMTAIDYPDATPDASWTYDANGNRTSMTDGAGTAHYSFDVLDRLTAVTRGGRTFSYGYDDAGNVITHTYPDGTVSALSYDHDGRLTGWQRDPDTTASFSHDNDGYPVLTQLPSADEQSPRYRIERSFDQAGRLTDVSSRVSPHAAASVRASYSYDLGDNPVSVTDHAGKTTTYDYDDQDRLTEVCFPNPGCTDFIRWTHDDAGNRLSEQRPAGTTTYHYNAAHQLTARDGPDGTVTYDYDLLGNQIRAGATTFSYSTAGSTTAAGATTYTYDGDGRRLSASNGGDSVHYDWDPITYQLATEHDGHGNITRRYHHALGPLGVTTPTGDLWYHPDATGSLLATSDAISTLQHQNDWEPYGALRDTTGPGTWPGTGWHGLFDNVHTEPDGLYHARARHYDPFTGRFLQPDPAATEPGSATYVYGAANPMAFTDPLGLWISYDTLVTINTIANTTAVVGGVGAIACTVAVVCAPAVPVLGTLAIGAGAVAAATDIAMAGHVCAAGKPCGAAIATAAIGTAMAVVPAGRLARPAINPAARALAPQARTPAQRGQYLFDNWHPATFPNRTQSVNYHVARHGQGRTAFEYTRDAQNFLAQNRNLATPVTLKDGTAGLRIQAKVATAGGGTRNVGGYWTTDGRLVTFWD